MRSCYSAFGPRPCSNCSWQREGATLSWHWIWHKKCTASAVKGWQALISPKELLEIKVQHLDLWTCLMLLDPKHQRLPDLSVFMNPKNTSYPDQYRLENFMESKCSKTHLWQNFCANPQSGSCIKFLKTNILLHFGGYIGIFLNITSFSPSFLAMNFLVVFYITKMLKYIFVCFSFVHVSIQAYFLISCSSGPLSFHSNIWIIHFWHCKSLACIFLNNRSQLIAF